MDTITNNFDFRKQNKNSEKEEFWNQYFAGFIDGDETLLISKLGYASLEITMDISDEHALQKMKHVLGGSVKTLTNAKAFRYRLHHKKGMLDLISRMNGKIQQTNRKVQLEKICNLYDIVCLPTSMLTQQNVWFAGFFDADGKSWLFFEERLATTCNECGSKKSCRFTSFSRSFWRNNSFG